MTSVDTLLKNWNLQGKLDILKIDTEGNDNKVFPNPSHQSPCIWHDHVFTCIYD